MATNSLPMLRSSPRWMLPPLDSPSRKYSLASGSLRLTEREDEALLCLPAGWRLRRHRGRGPIDGGDVPRDRSPVRWLRTVALTTLLSAVVAAGCSPSGDGAGAASTTASIDLTSTTGVPVASAARVAEAFADAWADADPPAMAALAEPEVVERAVGFGDPVGALECSTLQNGQYQCIVATSSGRRAYYLINRNAERVAWLSEYHEEASESAFPPALDDELEHGDRVFGVYLAVERVERSPGPDAQQAIADAAAVGYDVELSPDIDCDRGAREQLGLDPARDYSAVVLYFETRALAQQFVDLFEPGVVGTAAVTLFCLD